MGGTKEGGQAASKTNRKLYGRDYYIKLGAKGGKAKVPKGFAMNRSLARVAGRMGGTIGGRSTKKG